MIIGSIVNGYVIDHIPAGRGMDLYRYLDLGALDCEVALIKNAASDKLGRKDIIKIGELMDLNFDTLGLFDPHITINIIQNSERVQKLHPQLPETIVGVLQCKNPRCITSIEQELPQVFKLTERARGVYRCLYCETRAEK